MRKIFIILVALFSLLQCASLARSTMEAAAGQIKDKIARTTTEIQRLEGRIKASKNYAEKVRLTALLNAQRKSYKKLQADLFDLAAPLSEEETLAATEEMPAAAAPKKFKFEIGGEAGVFGGATYLAGELRFPLQYIFGPATTSARLALGYAIAPDMSRKYLPVSFDLIFNLPPGIITGVDSYVGGGVNYTALTSGRTAGTFGGELFYGVESEGLGGKMFGELGYGTLQTGFGPSQASITLLVGFRKGWGI